MGLITVNDFAANKVLTSAELNNFKNTVVNLLNGLLDDANIANNAIITAKIADFAVTTAKLANGAVTAAQITDLSITAAKLALDSITAAQLAPDCVGASEHDDISASTDTYHTAESIAVVDSGGKYTATEVEAALQEIATFVGMGSGVSGDPLKYIGFARDHTNVFPTNNPSAQITVPADSAPSGIIVSLSAHFEDVGNSGMCNCVVPLSINSTNLSTVTSHDPRYTLQYGSASGAIMGQFSQKLIYITSDGWDGTQTNTVEVGTPYWRADSTGCTGTTVEDFQIVVAGIQ